MKKMIKIVKNIETYYLATLMDDGKIMFEIRNLWIKKHPIMISDVKASYINNLTKSKFIEYVTDLYLLG